MPRKYEESAHGVAVREGCAFAMKSTTKRNEDMFGGIETGAEAALPFIPAGGGEPMMDDTGPDAGSIFERLRAQLQARLGADVYSSWFGRMKLAEASRGLVRLSVPTAFLRSWINNHYLALITDIWKLEDETLLRLEIVVRSAARTARGASDVEEVKPRNPPRTTQTALSSGTVNPARPVQPRAAPESGSRQSILGSPLDGRYTFESFVDGPSNRVAFAAARTVAENATGSVRFNPLFVHASVGLGKTHLLQAIAAESLARRPASRVVYLTAEYFMWRFATAIRDNNALTLKEQLRDIDLLIIDDMQFLQGKSIQHEFCHLINMLLDSAKQVVVAADRPASELESLEPRVRSRLQGGVSLEMSAPDMPMRLSMLKQRLDAARQDDPALSISDEVLEHVARTVTGSGRELEGAFNQLLFRQSFEPDLSIDRIDELLGHMFRTGDPKRIRIEDIQRIVARHYNVSKTELLSNRRTRTIVKPRQVAMYLAKVMTPRSLPEIGRRFGGRDHTTVLHAVRKIESLSGTDEKLEQELELLRRLINDQA